LAYGPLSQAVSERLHRGLQRVAARLEADDLAGAGVEAVLLRLPDVSAEGLRKLAAGERLRKGGADPWRDELRVPAGEHEGGEWTAGGPTSPSHDASASNDRSVSDPAETTIRSSVRQSRTPNANGFHPNSAGGGVFYVPSVSQGRPVWPTEIHVVDAQEYQVAWTDGAITLTDRAGRVLKVDADDLAHFNATTGRIRGVSIESFPDQPLGSSVDSISPTEQAQLDRDAAALEAGEETSENSLSGRLLAGGVVATAALPFVALLPVADAALPDLVLNTPEGVETGAYRAIRLGREGENAVGITGPKEPIEIPGSQRIRIPDQLDKAAKVLTEVKNVARVNLTAQLRDFLTYCRANGYTFTTYARRSTTYSAAVRALLRSGEITIIRIPGT
jgi:hypothetical protein